MIKETILGSGLVHRESDSGVKIRNTVTGHSYDEAIDLTNEDRVSRGLVPYSYEETDEPIEAEAEVIEE